MNRVFLLLCATALPALAQPTDLFLLIGQSNMAGRGVIEPRDQAPIPGVFTFTKDKAWAPAIDPLHFDKPNLPGVGLGRSFASTLIDLKMAKNVGLIPAAFGGSALEEWTPGSAHYQNAIARAKAALTLAGKGARLRGILWHQGEADSTTEARSTTYRTRFAAMIEQLRKDLSAEAVPVVIGQLGEFFTGNPFVATVNEQLAMLPLTVPLSGFVSSQGLKDKGDAVHFDSPGLRELGRRYALAWLALSPQELLPVR